jgi:hypothetical protein
MNYRHGWALLLAGSLGLAAIAIGYPARGAAPAAPPAGGGLTILEFKPAMDDLMTMMIQPRHTKLYYAGQQKNWTLAGFELNELGAALRRIGQTIPKYRNISVDATVQSIFAPKIQAMTAAINAKNLAQFNTAYADLTVGCNTCHEGLEHPFLVMKVPDGQNFPDQDFRPVPTAAGK